MPTDFSNEFGIHYQVHFVAHMLRDSKFLQKVKKDINSDFFTDEYLSRIVSSILTFGDGKTAPGDLLRQEVITAKNQEEISESVYANLNKYLDTLLGVQLQNQDYLLSKFKDFVQYSKIEANLGLLIDAAKERNFKGAKDLAADIFKVPMEDDLGSEFTKDPKERIARRVNQAPGMRTGIVELDKSFDGLRAGEVGVFQSRKSSDGKTAALVVLTRYFLWCGYNVLVYVLEGSVESWEDRLDQCLAGIPRAQLKDEDAINKGAGLFLHGNAGRVWIKKMPTYSTRVSDLIEHQKQLYTTTNFQPDVIIVDYLDLCAPETSALRSDAHAWGREVYTKFIEWISDLKIPGWTVQQSNRLGAESATADQQHVAGSIAKIQLATFVVSINTTPEDIAQNKLTLYIVKNREGKAKFPVVINCDFNRMLFWVPTIEVPEQNADGTTKTAETDAYKEAVLEVSGAATQSVPPPPPTPAAPPPPPPPPGV